VTDTPQRFRVIDGGGKPKAFRAPRKRSEPEPLSCHACETDKGHTGAVTITVKLGEMVRDGKPYGGTKAVICAHCLSRGKVTILI
jgi:hypothetical protein